MGLNSYTTASGITVIGEDLTDLESTGKNGFAELVELILPDSSGTAARVARFGSAIQTHDTNEQRGGFFQGGPLTTDVGTPYAVGDQIGDAIPLWGPGLPFPANLGVITVLRLAVIDQEKVFPAMRAWIVASDSAPGPGDNEPLTFGFEGLIGTFDFDLTLAAVGPYVQGTNPWGGPDWSGVNLFLAADDLELRSFNGSAGWIVLEARDVTVGTAPSVAGGPAGAFGFSSYQPVLVGAGWCPA